MLVLCGHLSECWDQVVRKLLRESSLWKSYPLNTTPGWPLVGKKTSLAPLYFPGMGWFWRWLHVGVIVEWETASYVSDENHIARGFNWAHSSHCEMLCLYSPCTPPLFFFSWLVFFRPRAIFAPPAPPLQMARSYLWFVCWNRVIHQRKCVWQPACQMFSSLFKTWKNINRKTNVCLLYMTDASVILSWRMWKTLYASLKLKRLLLSNLFSANEATVTVSNKQNFTSSSQHHLK